MNWRIIPKNKTEEPKRGTYSDWKDILADEGYNQCVYCTIHEGSFGRRNYHVEHYKPKGLKEFKHLENTFSNLFFACCICNCFKGDFWEDPLDNHSVGAFPDPSKIDYSELFELLPDSSLEGKNTAGVFIVEKLYLNRPQLLIERRIIILLERFRKAIKYFNELKGALKEVSKSGNQEATDYLIKIMDSYEKMNLIQIAIRESVPYTKKDVSRM